MKSSKGRNRILQAISQHTGLSLNDIINLLVTCSIGQSQQQATTNYEIHLDSPTQDSDLIQTQLALSVTSGDFTNTLHSLDSVGFAGVSTSSVGFVTPTMAPTIVNNGSLSQGLAGMSMTSSGVAAIGASVGGLILLVAIAYYIMRKRGATSNKVEAVGKQEDMYANYEFYADNPGYRNPSLVLRPSVIGMSPSTNN